MTEILLVRHGETDWNAEHRFQGHADPPLNERGREQARALATELAGTPFDALYASPLRRAAETAALLAAVLGVSVRHIEALREVDVGEWQGLTRAEVEERYPDAFASWLEFGPGWTRGETYEVLGERVLAALREIAAEHDGGRVLVVTHGGPLRAALAAAAGLPHAASRTEIRAVANCAVAAIHVHDGAFAAARESPPLPASSPRDNSPPHPRKATLRPIEDYTTKYKGEQVEVALFGGEYQEGTLTAYCYVDDVAHIELNGHILVPLQNIASLHCTSRCDAPADHWPPRGLAEDEPEA